MPKLPPECGVYEIRCSNGRRYIGSSDNMERRQRNHLTKLRAGRHQNPHLQRAWSKYGAGAFTFLVVETCAVDEQYAVEQRHLDAADKADLFNIAEDAARGAGRFGRLGKKNSREHNRRLREANLGKPSPRKGKTHTWGHKIRVAMTGRFPDIRARHQDGKVLVFKSTVQAAEVLGLKRKSVSNNLNGLSRRTRCGWTFERIVSGG